MLAGKLRLPAIPAGSRTTGPWRFAGRMAAMAGCVLALAAASPAMAAVPDTASPRVITLAPHATELVYAAGGGGLIVGTVSSSDFPEAALKLPRVGDGIILNPERIVVLRPTVLVAWLRSGAALEAEALARGWGAQTFYTAPARLRDIPADVRRLGKMLGTDAVAARAAAAMDARIDELEARYAGLRPVTVFIEVGSTPLYTIGGDALMNDAMRICGAINVYGSTPVPAPRVPIEGVLVQDPQLIVAPVRSERDLQAVQARWEAYGLSAAAQGHVHGADPDALFRPGPRFIDATGELCAAVDSVRRADKNELSLKTRSK